MVPESALINDSYVWVLNATDKLCRISAERMHSHEGQVYLQLSVNDLMACETKPPLRIVTRPLTNFKEGGAVIPVSSELESSN